VFLLHATFTHMHTTCLSNAHAANPTQDTVVKLSSPPHSLSLSPTHHTTPHHHQLPKRCCYEDKLTQPHSCAHRSLVRTHHTPNKRCCGPARYQYSGFINLLRSRLYEVAVSYQATRADTTMVDLPLARYKVGHTCHCL
jgi:hypothetical protein